MTQEEVEAQKAKILQNIQRCMHGLTRTYIRAERAKCLLSRIEQDRSFCISQMKIFMQEYSSLVIRPNLTTSKEEDIWKVTALEILEADEIMNEALEEIAKQQKLHE